MELPNITKKRIEEYIKSGKRFDGRKAFDFRNINVELNVSNKAEGSAKVTIGETEVIAGIKMDVSEPYRDSPDKGNLIVTTELLPLSSARFEPGHPTIESIELARIIDKGIRESGYIDFEKLCISKGELVWNVLVDVYSLNDDGNLLDAAFLASIIALRNTLLPELNKENKVVFGELTKNKLPLTEHMPINLSFYKIGEKMILDPNKREEDTSEVRVSLGLSFSKEMNVNSVQKSGSLAIDIKDIEEILKESKDKFKKIKEIIEKAK